MSVRILLTTVAILAVPAVANAADPSAGAPITAAPSEPQVQARRPDRAKPVPTPQQQRRRTIEAPNAALMLIPANYTRRG